jgi:hypothetical protein
VRTVLLARGRGAAPSSVLGGLAWESPLLHNGSTLLSDNTAAVQAAHDALPAGGGVIYTPGLFKCAGQLVFSKSVLLMGRKDGRSGGGANADGIWFTTTGAPPLTRSAVTGGVRAWLDASSTASPGFWNFELRGPAGDISNGYLLDWSYATTFVSYDSLINGSATTNLKAFIALGGGQGGAGAIRSTQFSGVAADAGNRWIADNLSDPTSGTMNNVEFDDILGTSCRGLHNPGTAWLFKQYRQEILNGEGILKMVIIDAGLPALDQPEIQCIECWAGDVTVLGDGNYFDAAGRVSVRGGQFQLLGANPALIKAVDPCTMVSDEDAAIFSTSPTAHVFDLNSKAIESYRSLGTHRGGGSTSFGTHTANGTPSSWLIQDIITRRISSSEWGVRARADANQTFTADVLAHDVVSLTVPANQLALGQRYKMRIRGTFATVTNADSLTFNALVGATTHAATNLAALAAGNTRGFDLSCDVIVQTINGAASKVVFEPINVLGGQAASIGAFTAQVTVDATAALVIKAQVQAGFATSTIVVSEATIELVQP